MVPVIATILLQWYHQQFNSLTIFSLLPLSSIDITGVRALFSLASVLTLPLTKLDVAFVISALELCGEENHHRFTYHLCSLLYQKSKLIFGSKELHLTEVARRLEI